MNLKIKVDNSKQLLFKAFESKIKGQELEEGRKFKYLEVITIVEGVMEQEVSQWLCKVREIFGDVEEISEGEDDILRNKMSVE